MKKRLIKALSVILTVMMLIGVVPMGAMTAFAADVKEAAPEVKATVTEAADKAGEAVKNGAETVKDGAKSLYNSAVTAVETALTTGVDGYYEYKVLGDGTAEITKYTGGESIIVIPATIDGYKVTSIGYHAFYDCESLRNVTIPYGVKSIGDWAFSGCISLANITISDSVESIGDRAFYYCTSLTNTTIPSSVTYIGESAFDYCTSLTNITIPSSVTFIGNRSFHECESLAEINVDSQNTVYTSDDGVLFSKDKTKLIKYPMGNEREEYDIPNGVVNIEEYALADCDNLESITIPNSVTHIRDYAFYDSNHIKSITIPDSVIYIGYGVIGWTEITDIYVDSNNTKYFSEDGVLLSKDKTELILYPVGRESDKYVIPNSVTYIGSGAFFYSTHLRNITIPEGVMSIGERAFAWCSNLTDITIPDGVTSIGYDTFDWCSSLEEITIPDSVTSIGAMAFNQCRALTEITIPNSVTYIGESAFHYCTSLTNITISSGLTNIAESTFEGCKSLTSITIPSGVTNIEEYAFASCESLALVIIPVSVTEIFESAFSNCYNLKFVDYGGTEEQWNKIDIEYDNYYLINADIHYAAGTKKITFAYPGKNKTATCYYTDDYFAESSYVYNPSLATMSMSFAWSAFGSSKGGTSDYTDKSINAKNLLMDIGVDETKIGTNEWFTVKPTTDSIGVVAGNKPITVKGKDYTLIALAVRGGEYEREWASNFTLGEYGQHDGFDTAKNNVINYLKTYVADQKITGPVKFWITGYSRAAATANLVGGAIDKGAVISKNISYTNDDVYTYCFETPAGAVKSEVEGKAEFNNIFNIINPNDLVPFVAPKALGFGRYGVDRYLPTAESSGSKYSKLKANMLKIYNSLGSTEEYMVDDFQMKKVGLENWRPGGEKITFAEDDTKNNFSQRLFLDRYVKKISNEIIQTRSNYVYWYQDGIREICSIVKNCTDEQSEIIKKSIANQAIVNGGVFLSYCFIGNSEKALLVVSGWIKQGLKDAGITDYDEAAVDEAVIHLTNLLLAVVISHPNYFTTAVANGTGIGAAHFPELCYSWLASMDYNYLKDAKVLFNNGGYRIIMINCEVDVEVLDNAGNTVAAIVNEQPVELDGSTYVYGVDEDGQKFVVLPVDADYKVLITGREDDKVNYSISEYSAMAGDYTRNINYFNIDLKQGEKLSGIIPAYADSEIEQDTPNGSNADYKLFDSSESEITKDSDFSGNEAQKTFNVNAQSSDSEYGIVFGSGTREYGTFAQLEAIPSEECSFVGWFDGETCVSTENPYRICVTEDIELTAKFIKEEKLPASVTLSPDTLDLFTGDKSKLTATVTPGSSDWTSDKMQNYGGTITWVKNSDLSGNSDVKVADGALKVASGYSGYTEWILYNDGTIVFSGNGNMRNYESASATPWYAYASDIKQVILENGVTSVGNYSFKNCASLSAVYLPDTLTKIGESAFYGCSALKSVIFPASVAEINNYAFSRTGLTEIKFLGNAPVIGSSAFSRVTATVYYAATVADEIAGWTSSNPNVAIVDENGNVTAVGAGTAVITVTTKNGLTATCTVTVKTKVIEVENVTLDRNSADVTVGESFKLTATVVPDNATDKSVTWTSSNPNVATVDENGNVTAVGAGTAVITVTTKNGLTATCTVTVNNPIPETPANLKITSGGKDVGEVYYVKAPNVFTNYKNCSTTLGFEFDKDVEVASVKWSYAKWSVNEPEANIESPDSPATVIRPNGKGSGARSTWITLTVTDTAGNVYQDTVKVRFYKWSWQVH